MPRPQFRSLRWRFAFWFGLFILTLATGARYVQFRLAVELLARDIDAQEALRLGIAMELHEPDQLLPRAQALARSFVGASPAAVALIKRNLLARRRSQDTPSASQLTFVF
jgi:enoyl-CoA hydratase/carnithine racemase